MSKAIANILVFINAHLAFNFANEVAVVASHSDKAIWLYPSQKPANTSNDVSRGDADGGGDDASEKHSSGHMNKYRPFRIVEEQVTHNLRQLLESTSADQLQATTSTMMAGALTMALSHINRRSIAWAEARGGASSDGPNAGAENAAAETLLSRILIVSVSSATGSAHQYIPIMNTIFACQRLRIPIDVCKLSGDAVFLQQACDATRGVYMSLSEPRGFLQYLMMAFLPDQRSRQHLVLPARVDVDFRAACFCHRRVVNIGFVCSICLSIFCEFPEDGNCLTCGTPLEMGDYGAKPVVVARKKKKKKQRTNGASGDASTPTPGT